jgi:hypothetical protein
MWGPSHQVLWETRGYGLWGGLLRWPDGQNVEPAPKKGAQKLRAATPPWRYRTRSLQNKGLATLADRGFRPRVLKWALRGLPTDLARMRLNRGS